MKNLSHIEFWKTEGINEYRNLEGPALHEGEENVKAIVEFVGNGPMRDFSCGYGRLATRFAPEQYVGYDMCEAAIRKAKRMFPEYKFFVWDLTTLPPAETTLFVDGLCCVPAEDTEEAMNLLCNNTKVVVLAELMDPTLDYGCRRSVEQYDVLFSARGFERTRTHVGAHTRNPSPFTVARYELRGRTRYELRGRN